MEQNATKKNLRIVVQPRLTDRSMDINIDANHNLAPSTSIWLCYEHEADELNEKRLAELDEAHAAVLRNFMQQTASLDAIEKANGIRFRDSRISLSIGRAYDLCEFIDQISKAINQVLDPRHELGKPEIVMDDSAYINDIIAPDLDTLLRAFIDFISKILSSSQLRKAFSIEIVVMTTQISTHMMMIALIPEPTHKIIIGPSAIFGSEFKTTIYGSKIRLSFSLHQSKMAISVPPIVAMAKPKMVSSSVMPMCPQIEPS